MHRSMEGVVEAKEAAVVGGGREGREEEEEGVGEDEICKCEDKALRQSAHLHYY